MTNALLPLSVNGNQIVDSEGARSACAGFAWAAG